MLGEGNRTAHCWRMVCDNIFASLSLTDDAHVEATTDEGVYHPGTATVVGRRRHQHPADVRGCFLSEDSDGGFGQ